MKTEPLYSSRKYRDIRELVEETAKLYPDDIAFSYRKHPHDVQPARIPFPLFCHDVRALATEFLAHGTRGKHCAVIGKLSYGWVLTYFALLASGSVIVPLDRDWHTEDLAKTAREADCEFLFCDDPTDKKAVAVQKELGGCPSVALSERENVESVFDWMRLGDERLQNGDRAYYVNRIDPMALAILVFTSGTTGSGKGVMLSQNALVTDLYAGLQIVKLHKKTIAVLPPHHTYGSSVGLVANFTSGAEVYLSDGLRHVQRELREEKPEHMTLVPLFVETFYRKIWASAREQGKEKLLRRMMRVTGSLRRVKIDVRRQVFQSIHATFGGRLRLIISGGAPISREIVDTFEALGITVINGYGITECSPLVSATRNSQREKKPGCVGTPLPCMKVKIHDADANGEGEICVKGNNVMMGYYKNDEATREAFDEHDYFRTGDLGRFDENGLLYITGRSKNLIILANGKNVYPEEIESALSATGGILEIVVYEGKSPRGVEHNAIVAEVYPDAEFFKKNGIEDVRAHLQAAVDAYNKTAVPYKKIGLLRIRDEEFPKNTLRKILRFKIDMNIE